MKKHLKIGMKLSKCIQPPLPMDYHYQKKVVQNSEEQDLVLVNYFLNCYFPNPQSPVWQQNWNWILPTQGRFQTGKFHKGWVFFKILTEKRYSVHKGYSDTVVTQLKIDFIRIILLQMFWLIFIEKFWYEYQRWFL